MLTFEQSRRIYASHESATQVAIDALTQLEAAQAHNQALYARLQNDTENSCNCAAIELETLAKLFKKIEESGKFLIKKSGIFNNEYHESFTVKDNKLTLIKLIREVIGSDLADTKYALDEVE
jgi:hypothetical protein